jgi:uncharacterized protein
VREHADGSQQGQREITVKGISSTASFRFYAELNDFLPQAKKQTAFEHSLAPRTSVKDAIESLGVPHTEVDLIIVNGISVELSYRVQDGDRISVYPVFEALDIAPLSRLRPEPLRQPRFVLDAHLGRLAAYLRLAGFDTLYRNDFRDEELARISATERRTLLTRDQGLLKRSAVSHGYWLRETSPRRQFIEILRRFDLTRIVEPFVRCLRCNEPLDQVPLAAVANLVPPRVRERVAEFHMCRTCRRAYWKGSHYEAMVRTLDAALDAARLPVDDRNPREGA